MRRHTIRRVRGKIVFTKGVMGDKTVFIRDAGERKDLDVLQVFIEFQEPLAAAIGLQVDVCVDTESPHPSHSIVTH